MPANYDTRASGPEEDPPPDDCVVDPVVCSNCHEITAQPRYVIHRHVVSAVVVTWRSERNGVFCPNCGAKRACWASLKTWLLGWWGIPWGPIYSVQAIFSNLFGGEMPPLKNFRILGWQAIYFAQIGRLNLAYAVAESALRFAQKIPEQERLNDARTSREIRALAQLLASPGIDDRPPEDPWGCRSMAFRVQAGAVLAAAALIVAGVFLKGRVYPAVAYMHAPPTESVSPKADIFDRVAAEANKHEPPTKSGGPNGDIVDQVLSGQTIRPGDVAAFLESQKAPPASPVFSAPPLTMPATGKLHALWRANPSLVLAPLRVKTAAGSPNYYVKIVDWAERETHGARLVFFVRSGQTVDVGVPIGTYELRYAAGETWYGEEYLFGPETVYRRTDEQFVFCVDGDRVLGFTVELIKQIDGNLKETPIRPADF